MPPTGFSTAGDFLQALKRDLRFFVDHRWLIPGLVMMLLLRLFYGSQIPLGNDEAYYWDWGRGLQLSYFDHPPGVAWLAWLGQQVGQLIGRWCTGMTTSAEARLVIPFLHLGATVGLGACLSVLYRRLSEGIDQEVGAQAAAFFFVCTQLLPVYALGGFFLMPDAGLIFAVSWALYGILRALEVRHLGWREGFILGCFWGLAGCFKYHAAPLAMATLGVLFWHRRMRVSRELGFWFTLVMCGLLWVSPVLLWNFQHDWASLRYQSGRGLSGNWDVRSALRTLLGEVLFLSPLYAWFLAMSTVRALRLGHPALQVMVSGFLALLILLKIFSFTSQTLPHWSMPGVWLMLPAVSILASEVAAAKAIPKGVWWINDIFIALLVIVVPMSLASREARSWVLSLAAGRPGGLGELTFWDGVVGSGEVLSFVNHLPEVPKQEFCPQPFLVAGMRWHAVAQLAVHFPGHPKTISLDDKLSYYTFRDRGRQWSGCPVLVLSEQPHGDRLAQKIEVLQRQDLVLPSHRDRPFFIAFGLMR